MLRGAILRVPLPDRSVNENEGEDGSEGERTRGREEESREGKKVERGTEQRGEESRERGEYTDIGAVRTESVAESRERSR